MPLPLVSTVPKYVNTGLKNSLLLDPTTKRWSKIALHVSSKKVAIATKFIVVVTVLKAEVASPDTSKLTLASKKTMRHHKSDGLNVIHKSRILFVIINACSWKQYS